MGWLGWGLGIAHAFTPIVIILFEETSEETRRKPGQTEVT